MEHNYKNTLVENNSYLKSLCTHHDKEEFWKDDAGAQENFIRLVEFMTNQLYKDPFEDYVGEYLPLPDWNKPWTINIRAWNCIAAGVIMQIASIDQEFFKLAVNRESAFDMMARCMRNAHGKIGLNKL